MTKKQMILDILSKTNKYTLDQLIKLWYSELKILHHHVVEEKERVSYDIE